MPKTTINSELLDYFLNYLRRHSDRAEKTIINIKRDTNNFLNYVEDHAQSEINPESIRAYIDFLEKHYLESSFITKLSNLRQFINWLNLEENPFWKLKFSYSPEDFSVYDLTETLTKIEFDYEDLLVGLIYELYLSIDELVALNIENYNQASSKFLLRGSTVEISELLAKKLRIYLKEKRKEILGEEQSVNLEDPLLLRPKIIDPQAIRITAFDVLSILKKKDFKNTTLKRSRILDLLALGLSIEDIEKKLALKLSDFYRPFEKEKPYRLSKAYKDFHPRASL